MGATPTVSSVVEKVQDKMVKQGGRSLAQSSSGGVRKDEKVRGVMIN